MVNPVSLASHRRNVLSVFMRIQRASEWQALRLTGRYCSFRHKPSPMYTARHGRSQSGRVIGIKAVGRCRKLVDARSMDEWLPLYSDATNNNKAHLCGVQLLMLPVAMVMITMTSSLRHRYDMFPLTHIYSSLPLSRPSFFRSIALQFQTKTLLENTTLGYTDSGNSTSRSSFTAVAMFFLFRKPIYPHSLDGSLLFLCHSIGTRCEF